MSSSDQILADSQMAATASIALRLETTPEPTTTTEEALSDTPRPLRESLSPVHNAPSPTGPNEESSPLVSITPAQRRPRTRLPDNAPTPSAPTPQEAPMAPRKRAKKATRAPAAAMTGFGIPAEFHEETPQGLKKLAPRPAGVQLQEGGTTQPAGPSKGKKATTGGKAKTRAPRKPATKKAAVDKAKESSFEADDSAPDPAAERMMGILPSLRAHSGAGEDEQETTPPPSNSLYEMSGALPVPDLYDQPFLFGRSAGGPNALISPPSSPPAQEFDALHMLANAALNIEEHLPIQAGKKKVAWADEHVEMVDALPVANSDEVSQAALALMDIARGDNGQVASQLAPTPSPEKKIWVPAGFGKRKRKGAEEDNYYPNPPAHVHPIFYCEPTPTDDGFASDVTVDCPNHLTAYKTVIRNPKATHIRKKVKTSKKATKSTVPSLAPPVPSAPVVQQGGVPATAKEETSEPEEDSSMGGKGSGRRKGEDMPSQKSQSISIVHAKQRKESKGDNAMKSKAKLKTPAYQGPPEYLLGDNREDAFADATNIYLGDDGTFRPINGGAWAVKNTLSRHHHHNQNIDIDNTENMAPVDQENYHGHESGEASRRAPPPSPNPNSDDFGYASLPSPDSNGFNFTSFQSVSHTLRPGYESQHGTKRQNDFDNYYKVEGGLVFAEIDIKDEPAKQKKPKRRRVRSPTPEPLKDYPVPKHDNMNLPKECQEYRTKLTNKQVDTTTAEFMLERVGFLKEARAARQERDDREMFEGLKNYDGNQRGWNGEPEAERRKEEQARRDLDAEEEDDTPPNIIPQRKRRKITVKLLEEGFEALSSSYTINNIHLQDAVEYELEHGRTAIVNSRPWDADAIRMSALEDQERRWEKERIEEERFRKQQRKKSSDQLVVSATDMNKEDSSKRIILDSPIGQIISLPASPLRVAKNPSRNYLSRNEVEKVEEDDIEISKLDSSPSRGRERGLGLGGIGRRRHGLSKPRLNTVPNGEAVEKHFDNEDEEA